MWIVGLCVGQTFYLVKALEPFCDKSTARLAQEQKVVTCASTRISNCPGLHKKQTRKTSTNKPPDYQLLISILRERLTQIEELLDCWVVCRPSFLFGQGFRAILR
jgi:hypothetical protein